MITIKMVTINKVALKEMLCIQFRPPSLTIARRWIFNPGMYSSIITLLLLPLFVYLGFWQLERGKQKKHLIAAYHLNQQQAPMDWDPHDETLQTNGDEAHLSLKHFHMAGRFVGNFQILVDNKTYQGRIGVQIYALFKPKNSNTYILVDRGFMPLKGQSRQNLQSLELNYPLSLTKEDTITGTVTFPPRSIQLSQKTAMQFLNAEQLLIQQIDYEKLSQYLNLPLAKFVFKLDGESPFILTFMPIHLGLSPCKHFGYALQWFTMATAVIIYYFVINTRRSKR